MGPEKPKETEQKFPTTFVDKVENLGPSEKAATDPSEGITKEDVNAFRANTAAQLEHLKPLDAFTQRARIIKNADRLEKALTDDHKDIKEALKLLRTETEKLQPLQGKLGVKYVEPLIASPINTIKEIPTTIKHNPALGIAAAGIIALPAALWIMRLVRGRPSSIVSVVLRTLGLATIAATAVSFMGNSAQKAEAEELLQKQKESKVAKLPKVDVENETAKYPQLQSLPENLMFVNEGRLNGDPSFAINTTTAKPWGVKFLKGEKPEDGVLLQAHGRTYRVTTTILKGGKNVEFPALHMAMVVKQGNAKVLGVQGPLLKEGGAAPIYLHENSIAYYVGEMEKNNQLQSFNIDAILPAPDQKDPAYAKKLELLKKENGANWPDGGGSDDKPGKFLHAPVKIKFTPVSVVPPLGSVPL